MLVLLVLLLVHNHNLIVNYTLYYFYTTQYSEDLITKLYTVPSTVFESGETALSLSNMPKKFQGENSKAVEARARKAAAKKDEADKKQKAAEDAYWEDDDKNNAKKAQRKVP